MTIKELSDKLKELEARIKAVERKNQAYEDTSYRQRAGTRRVNGYDVPDFRKRFR